MTVYSGISASIYLANTTTAVGVAFDENLVDISGVNPARTIWTLPTGSARLTKRFWDSTQTTTVYVNGTPVVSGFTIQYIGGIIRFNPAAGAGVVRVTGTYIPVTQVATASEWTLQVQRVIADASVLGGDGWKAAFPIQKAGSITFTHLLQSSTDYEDYFASTAYVEMGLKLLVVLWISRDATTGAGKGYACFARAGSAALAARPTEIEREQLNLESVGKVYAINDP